MTFLEEDGSLMWSRVNKYKNIMKLIHGQYTEEEFAKQIVKIKKVRESQERCNSETLGSDLKKIRPSNLNG